MSEPERRIWAALRQAFPGTKFRRQVPFGLYHADFCSHAARLVIEIDGDDHAHKLAKDAVRTAFLANEGYAVLRFGNDDVMRNLDGVVTAISEALNVQKGGP